MRRIVRVFLLVVGTVLAVAGLAAAVLVGTDDTVRTGDAEMTSDTAALTTSSPAIDLIGPTLHVAAATGDGQDVFVGVGHEVDVDAYLDGVAHDQITRIVLPWSPDVVSAEGDTETVAAPPDSRDWWYVQASGTGRQEVSYELGEEPVRVVVMRADGQPPVTVDLEIGYQIDNLFTTALLVLGVGLILLLVATFLLRRRERPRRGAGRTRRTESVTPEETHP